jgi:maltose alpha-D-glucosyltransferase/alpha-amylase
LETRKAEGGLRASEGVHERDPLWYKDAIIYHLHVKAFYDSNNDGIGDFRGLTERLEYIRDLGATAIWVMPFYPSPLKDDGYDISEFKNVHPDYGTRRDFRAFVRKAHRLGLKVITELVVNHTSDQHPWFQRARRSPKGSAWRDFYVWSDDPHRYDGTRIIFTDTERSNWSWDDVAEQYYWHRFFSHQPDLNHENPRVFKAIMGVMRFWLDVGVDGLRLDAIPYLIEREGTDNENLPETHDVLKRMRAEMDQNYEDRLFLAEANQWPEDVRPYFGDGDECHMAFHFPLMPRIYMAVAQEDRHPIVEIMHQTPHIPDNCQWAIFLRNHDELTLEMVTDRERDYMYQTYAHDPRMRINLGIRRRLAPLMQNDRPSIELLNSLLLSMPGTPIIYYGDEIGMGDNVFLGDRDSVRTPMQWTPDRNAGFSRVDPPRLYLPPAMDPVYGYEALNVEAQSRSSGSLLNWMKRLISVRKNHKAFGRGTLEFLHPGNRKVLAYLREHEGETVLCVANLSRSAQPVELDLSRFVGRVPVELMGGATFPPVGALPYLLTLPGHSFYWFRLATEVAVPRWHEVYPQSPQLPVLVLPAGRSPNGGRRREVVRIGGRQRMQLEKEALPEFLRVKRWFAAKGKEVERIEVAAQTELSLSREKGGGRRWILALLRVHLAASGDAEAPEPQLYSLPLGAAWEDGDSDPLSTYAPNVLAKLRRRSQVGVLYDAFAEEEFIRDLIRAMREGRRVRLWEGKIHFSGTTALEESLSGEDGSVARSIAEDAAGSGDPISEIPIRRAGVEQTNTSVIVGEKLILKAYRRLQEGTNPDLEVARFLARAGFGATPPLAGAVEYSGPETEPTTIAIMQGFVPNQGDGWSFTLDHLSRYLEDRLTRPWSPDEEDLRDEEEEERGADEFFMSLMRTLGYRTGELHRAFASPTDDEDFAIESVSREELGGWTGEILAELKETLSLLERRKDLPEGLRESVERLLDARVEFQERIRQVTKMDLDLKKTRHHGDYHLGQVLVTGDDFQIIDFEGEPDRPIHERRRKHSPLRDVAGMLRSFNYAAHSAVERVSIERMDHIHQTTEWARRWEENVRAAFLEGYEGGSKGCASVPEDREHARALIDLFTLEKALYEIRYELNNRPDWVGIPVRGILGLLDEPESEET